MEVETRIWSVPDWCAEAHLSRGWFYCQPAHLKPKHVKLGRSLRIVESPREFALRIQREQAAAIEPEAA
jgi:hypothetical protein